MNRSIVVADIVPDINQPSKRITNPGFKRMAPSKVQKGIVRAGIHFCVPYKVMIRVQQLVLLVLTSIGWHHCRTRSSISPRNWSTVMWPVPIGWWRRVPPAINTTRVQARGSVLCGWFFVDSSLSTWSCRWAHLPVLAVRYTTGSSPCWERPPVERARPTTFHSVYCLGVSPTSPRGLERPVMCDTRVPCTENL